MNNFLDEINSPSPRIHENAYPEGLNKLCNNVDANKLIQRRLTEWNLGINVDDYTKWLKHKNRTDHGIISALSQLKVIDAIYQMNNPNREERDIIVNGLDFNQRNFSTDIVSASSALFIHDINLDYDGFSNKINFELAPIAFLLFLCDTFQEWDRHSENRPIYSGEEFDINCTSYTISLFVPEQIEDKVFSALNQRLSGLTIRVNERIAVE